MPGISSVCPRLRRKRDAVDPACQARHRLAVMMRGLAPAARGKFFGRARAMDGDDDGIARCDIGALEFTFTIFDDSYE